MAKRHPTLHPDHYCGSVKTTYALSFVVGCKGVAYHVLGFAISNKVTAPAVPQSPYRRCKAQCT
jgi:hypothetical protein